MNLLYAQIRSYTSKNNTSCVNVGILRFKNQYFETGLNRLRCKCEINK